LELVIRTKTIVRAMIIAVLLLTLAGLAARFALYVFGDGPFLRPLSLFDVGAERNIPTWFESMQFMLCSVLLAVVALSGRQRGGRYTKHWGFLSIILLYMSLDEVATIHETIGAELERTLHATTGFTPSGAISFFWVVPAAIFVLVVALSYLRFLFHLPGSTRWRFVFAVAVFLLGAIGFEMLTAEVVSSSGAIASWVASSFGGEIGRGTANAIPTLLKGGQTSIEEMLEMLGLTAFVWALLTHISSYVDEDIAVRVSTDKSG
jgi:hypothetical protein